MKKKILVKAYAKLNLILQITGRRPDGFHNINSLMQSIDLHDTLSISLIPKKEGYLKITTDYSSGVKPYISPDFSAPADPKKNICGKVANVFFEKFNITDGIEINLKKRIPIGAGLGGGSSDGAATARALNSLFSLNLNESQLCAIVKNIGADIPFNIHGGTAAVTGIGDKINILPGQICRDFLFILIYPGIHSSTPAVYKNIKNILTHQKNFVKLFIKQIEKDRNIKLLENLLINDLKESAYNLYAQMSGIAGKIESLTNKKAQMSGSGSTLFLIYPRQDCELLKKNYLTLKKKLNGCLIFKTAPI